MRKVSLLYYVVSTCATCLLHTEQSLISSIVLLFSEPHTELTVATCVTAIAVPQDNPCLLHSTKMEHCFFFFKQGIGKNFCKVPNTHNKNQTVCLDFPLFCNYYSTEYKVVW